jgi:hypothetical protein
MRSMCIVELHVGIRVSDYRDDDLTNAELEKFWTEVVVAKWRYFYGIYL